MTTQTRISLDDFLALPEKKPYREYLAGEVIERVAPDAVHGRAVFFLSGDIDVALQESGAPLEGMTEVRHEDRVQDWTYLPDINVTSRDRLPENWLQRGQGPLQVTPDFAIEVLSPDDSAHDILQRIELQRIELYMTAGLRLLWILDADAESITAHEPGKPWKVYRAPQTMDASPVFPEFKLDLGAFFDRLYGRGPS